MPTIDYSLSLPEYAEACRVARGRKSQAHWRQTRYPALACIIVGIVAMIMGLPRIVLAVALPLAGLYYAWYFTGREYRELGLAYEYWRDLAESATVQWDDDHLILQTPQMEVRWRWQAFLQLVETPHVLLLTRPGGDPRLILPRRLFTPEQLADFRRVAREQTPGPSHGFPVLPR